MAALDPLATIITILTDNWNSANTDSLTPTFRKITDIKRLDFNSNKDQILIWRSTEFIEPAGVGDANKHETDKFNTDIRVFGVDNEQHFLNVVEEVKRIYQDKKVLPATGYTVLDFDGSAQDMSDKMAHIWRKLLPTQLLKVNVSR